MIASPPEFRLRRPPRARPPSYPRGRGVLNVNHSSHAAPAAAALGSAQLAAVDRTSPRRARSGRVPSFATACQSCAAAPASSSASSGSLRSSVAEPFEIKTPSVSAAPKRQRTTALAASATGNKRGSVADQCAARAAGPPGGISATGGFETGSVRQPTVEGEQRRSVLRLRRQLLAVEGRAERDVARRPPRRRAAERGAVGVDGRRRARVVGDVSAVGSGSGAPSSVGSFSTRAGGSSARASSRRVERRVRVKVAARRARRGSPPPPTR